MPKFQTATAAAEWVNRLQLLIGWALILSGVAGVWGLRAPVPVLEFAAGLILVLIGILNPGATVTGSQACSQAIGTHVPVVPPNITISNLVQEYVLMSEEQLFPVIANDYFVGLVSLHDALAIPRDRWETTEVGEIMSSARRLAVVEAKEVQCKNDLAHRNTFGRIS